MNHDSYEDYVPEKLPQFDINCPYCGTHAINVLPHNYRSKDYGAPSQATCPSCKKIFTYKLKVIITESYVVEKAPCLNEKNNKEQHEYVTESIGWDDCVICKVCGKLKQDIEK